MSPAPTHQAALAGLGVLSGTVAVASSTTFTLLRPPTRQLVATTLRLL